MKRSMVIAAAALAAGALALSGCSGQASPETSSTPSAAGDFDSVVTAAKAEGTLNLYSIDEQTSLTNFAAKFTEKYGVKVTIVRLTDGALRQRFLAEQQAGQKNADVVEVTGPLLAEQNPQMFADLDTSGPGYEGYPKDYLTPKTAIAWVSPYGIGYNTSQVTTPPKEWKDLLDSDWKGKLLLIDPKASAGYMGWADSMKSQFGEKFLTGLAAQDPQITESGTTGAQLVGAGSAPLIVDINPGLIAPQKDAGAPVDWVSPKGAPATAGASAIPSDAPHPNAAQLWVNYRISQEGQNEECTVGGNQSVRPTSDVTACDALPDGWKLINFKAFEDESVSGPILQALKLQ